MAKRVRRIDDGCATRVIPQPCLPNHYRRLNPSEKFGPETEKVFSHFRKAQITVRYEGNLVGDNHTSIDRLAPLFYDKKTFLEILAWNVIEIARSRWSINEDGKATCSNNTIVMTDRNVEEMLKFCRTGGSNLKFAKGYAKAMTNGRWLTLSTLGMSVYRVFNMPLQRDDKPRNKNSLIDLDKVAVGAFEKGIEQQLMAKVLEEMYIILNLPLPPGFLGSTESDSFLPRKWRGVSITRSKDKRYPDRIWIRDSFVHQVYHQLLHSFITDSSTVAETFHATVREVPDRIGENQTQNVMAAELQPLVVTAERDATAPTSATRPFSCLKFERELHYEVALRAIRVGMRHNWNLLADYRLLSGTLQMTWILVQDSFEALGYDVIVDKSSK
jgi:hypothetical protein